MTGKIQKQKFEANTRRQAASRLRWGAIPGKGFTAAIGIRVGLVLALAAWPAAGQLAITEAMSLASMNALVDFWELTNFGTNDQSLDGYVWNDMTGGRLGDAASLDGLTLSSGETIVFFQAGGAITDEQAFRDWWGGNLPATTRIFSYFGNGLGQQGDGIRL